MVSQLISVISLLLFLADHLPPRNYHHDDHHFNGSLVMTLVRRFGGVSFERRRLLAGLGPPCSSAAISLSLPAHACPGHCSIPSLFILILLRPLCLSLSRLSRSLNFLLLCLSDSCCQQTFSTVSLLFCSLSFKLPNGCGICLPLSLSSAMSCSLGN